MYGILYIIHYILNIYYIYTSVLLYILSQVRFFSLLKLSIMKFKKLAYLSG